MIPIICKVTEKPRYYIEPDTGKIYDERKNEISILDVLRLYEPSTNLVLIDGTPAYYKDMHDNIYTLEGKLIHGLDARRTEYPDLEIIKCAICKEPKYAYSKQENKVFDLDGNQLKHKPDTITIMRIAEGFPCDEACIDCFEILEESNTLVIIDNDTKESYHFNTRNGTLSYERDELLRKYEKEVLAIMKGTKWISTGWRGYYTFEADPNIVCHIDDDTLLTGHHSMELAKAKHDAYIQGLKTNNIPIFIIISTTGNIFANNIDYFVRAADSELAKNIASFVKKYYEDDDWRWCVGVIFTDNQGTKPTQDIVNAMKEKPTIPKTTWNEIAKKER